MRRREFITLLGGMAAAWPIEVRAQQKERVRRLGVLNTFTAEDPEGQARIAALLQALQPLGWTVGTNLRIDHRWGTGNAATTRKNAAELVALAPDVILTSGAAGVGPLLETTDNVPVVFVLVADPVGAGFIDSMARPGRNATGFIAVEYGMGSKLLELLKEIGLRVMRAAIIRDPAISAGIGMFGAIQSAAPSLGVEVTPVNVRDTREMENAIATFTRTGDAGLVVTPSPLAFVHRDLIVSLAARHNLPAVYFTRTFVAAGGLACYGPDNLDQYRRAAAYVDRILRGEKPADLPVQAPTKYELVINLKTAKALGLQIPDSLLARADEVIE
jgi:putative tryptophan/tyrosine transport system substrate-binding protein